MSYWVITTSLVFILGFYFDYGLLGIRTAMLISQVFLSVNFNWMLEQADWHKAAMEAKERQEREEELKKEIKKLELARKMIHHRPIPTKELTLSSN